MSVEYEKAPLVSIAVPCYNHRKYIEDCLKSIIGQTYPNIEVLICDDCSPDNSFEVIKKYEGKLKKRFKRVYIERNDVNLGITKNLNKLIKRCSGKYVKIIASDDILLDTSIEDLVRYAEKNPEYDIIYSNAFRIYSNDRYPIKNVNNRVKIHNKVQPSGYSLTTILSYGCYICAPTTMIRASTYEKYGLYNENLSYEDWEYWLRVSTKGCIGYLDKVTAAYRIIEGSMCHLTVSEEGRKKHQKRYIEDFKILNMYSKYTTEKTWYIFFNSIYGGAVALNDRVFARKIAEKMNRKRIKLSVKNKIKYFLNGFDIYPRFNRRYIGTAVKKFLKNFSY